MTQLRLSTLLNSAVSHPTSLPPSAIVFIRKLSDPLPRSLRIEERNIRPSAAWQQALNAKLETLAGNAARPALGAVPAGAQAVVFLDWSELLASLASDWSEGQIAMRWWWRHLSRNAPTSQIVKELWSSAPEYVPAALEKLARAGNAVRFVKTFSQAEAQVLLKSVARVFRLDKLVRVIDEVAFERQASGSLPLYLETQSNVRSTSTVARSAPPWKHLVREHETSDLGPAQEILLGIALMLQRTPASVRAKSFARAVETWLCEIFQPETYLREIMAPPPVTLDSQPIKATPQIATTHVETTSSASIPSATSVQQDSIEVSIDSARVAIEAIDSISVDTKSPPSKSQDLKQLDSSHEAPAASPRQTLVSSMGQISTTSPDEYEWAISESSTESPSVTFDPLPLVEFQIETDLGGLFYLINLGIYLGYYGDFTTPMEPGIDLNIWDFVVLLGRELLDESVQADPVWSLLDRLSGRTEGEEPDRVWLDQQLPYIRTRLRLALGLNESEDPGPLVCKQPARICLTPSHVDISIALSDLPIEIRLSGLDRDPGWVPAAGRFINFHFE